MGITTPPAQVLNGSISGPEWLKAATAPSACGQDSNENFSEVGSSVSFGDDPTIVAAGKLVFTPFMR